MSLPLSQGWVTSAPLHPKSNAASYERNGCSPAHSSHLRTTHFFFMASGVG